MNNFLIGIIAAGLFMWAHQALLIEIGNYMKSDKDFRGRPKEPNMDFTPPAMLSFPAPEIILFFMYYNGVLQAR